MSLSSREFFEMRDEFEAATILESQKKNTAELNVQRKNITPAMEAALNIAINVLEQLSRAGIAGKSGLITMEDVREHATTMLQVVVSLIDVIPISLIKGVDNE